MTPTLIEQTNCTRKIGDKKLLGIIEMDNHCNKKKTRTTMEVAYFGHFFLLTDGVLEGHSGIP